MKGLNPRRQVLIERINHLRVAGQLPLSTDKVDILQRQLQAKELRVGIAEASVEHHNGNCAAKGAQRLKTQK